MCFVLSISFRRRSGCAGFVRVSSAYPRWSHRLEPWTFDCGSRCQRHRRAGFDERIDVDVIVETETAVYGVLVFNESDVDTGDSTRACPDAVLRVIDAVSWYAGVRECYIALVTSDPSHTPIGTSLVRRYGASREVTFRRLSHRRDRLANVAGIGGLTWADMASILRDCAEADALTEFERYAASRTARWLGSIGIHPVD